MSDTKWEVGETYKDASNPAGVTEITDGSGYVVAFVPRHMGSSRADRRNSFPHMIAAALEMYEALDAYVNDDGRLTERERKNLARAALAKARP